MECVLISASMKSGLLEPFYNGINILNMLLIGIGVNQNVIKVGDTELVQELMEDVIDIGLERCKSIREIKGHDEVFKVSIAGSKGSLPLISFGYIELVEGG